MTIQKNKKYFVKACPNCAFYKSKKTSDGLIQECFDKHQRTLDEWFEINGRKPLREHNPSMDLDCYSDNIKSQIRNEMQENLSDFMSDLNAMLKLD